MKVKRDDQTRPTQRTISFGRVAREDAERERERWSQSQTKVSYAETKLPAAVDK